MMIPDDQAPLAWLEEVQGKRIPIQGTCSLGRAASNQVALPDERVSRRHAIIHSQGAEEFCLVDLGSRNGTYLNGLRLIQPTQLQNNDLIQVGPFQLRFRLGTPGDLAHEETQACNRTAAEIRMGRCWLLVADIIESTKMLESLPPDEVPLLTGQWLAECKQTMEEHGGSINQFLGDGFFAYWHDGERKEVAVSRALQSMKRMQEHAQPAFRVVVHYGQVILGGLSLGEERLSGRDVHFVFRLEKLASGLAEPRLLSHPAWERLAALMELRQAGRHALPGFEGEFDFYAF